VNAVAYLRVSHPNQAADSRDGFHRQLVVIHAYAATQGYEIIDEFRDSITGKTELEGRTGLAACLERVENNGVKVVICESADRLARDAMVAELIIRQFQKVGGRVIAASGGVDLTAGDDLNPTAKLIRQILAAVAEFDRCVITLKLRSARQRMKAKTGRCEGRKPFGDLGGESSILADLVRMNESHTSSDDIATILNTTGVPTRSGAQWRGSVIRKILRRHFGTKSAPATIARNEPRQNS
jgi:DNA invertase Pin-like site-specific DNA recombinase